MPCECCTRRTDAGEAEAGGVWLAGHIVSFRPIGHEWSANYLEKGYILRIVDADIEQARDVLMREHKTPDDFANFKRVYRIRFDELPRWTQQSLESTGRADVTLEQLRQASRHAITREKW